MSYEARARELGIEIPPAPQPVAAYIPGLVQDGWLYVSGQIPVVAGEPVCRGKLGAGVSPEEGYGAARRCALNALGVVRAVAGSLDRVARVVKITAFVASARGWNGQSQVANGASELFGELFGEAGRHARSAVGVAELPLDVPVEVEAVFRLQP